MPKFRMKGRTLRTALRVVRTAPGRAIAHRVMMEDYGIRRMLELPDTYRAPLRLPTEPLQGAAPRQVAGEELPTPSPLGTQNTARRFRAAFAAGTTTPTRVLEAIFRAEDERAFGETSFSSFSSMDRKRAREAAEVATLRWRDGKPLSPLDGIPVVVKDEHQMRGLETRCGTRYANLVAKEDSFVVSELRRSGAVLYAKTHATEWGMNPIGFNPHYAMPRNPYSSSHAAGGSSTGSGTAVAMGFAPIAVGSDGGGSIRIPSAFCGLFGIKPSFGRLSSAGNWFAGGSVSVGGPMARSTEDLVDTLGVMSRLDRSDPFQRAIPENASGPDAWSAALGRGAKGMRIGVPASEWRAADPAIAEKCELVLRALEAAGAEIVHLDVRGIEHSSPIGVLSIAPETMTNLADDMKVHGELYSLELQLILAGLMGVSAGDYLSAQRARAALRVAAAESLQKVDLLAMPSTAIMPPRYELSETWKEIADDEATRNLCRLNFFANLTGLPAGCAPAGMIDGLPVGIQFVGDAWDEATVFAALAAVERSGVSKLPEPKGYLDAIGAR